MSYAVKEIFYSLQGEGREAGRPAIFIRFMGCNLWSGREEDRLTSGTICHFCDTDLRAPAKESGGIFADAGELAQKALKLWPQSAGTKPYIIFTGGEPLLQLDEALCQACHAAGATVACETNGTIATTLPIDWLTVSPKAGAKLKQTSGSELKAVYPQEGLDLEKLATLSFKYFFLQPCDNIKYKSNLASAVAYCEEHPEWRLSIQLHKVVGVE